MAKAGGNLLLEIIRPVVDYQNDQPTSTRASRPHTVQGKSVALIANWKPISLPLMEIMAEQLAQKTDIESAFASNPNWQFTHPDRVWKIGPEVDELARKCHLMVSGVAD